MCSGGVRIKQSTGFTLLELLIVLMLIGIVTSFTVSSVDRLSTRLDERRWADTTFSSLAKLRNKAILSGSVVVAIIHFDAGELRLPSASGAEVLIALPQKFRFVSTDVAARDEVKTVDRMPLYFYPDGTMDEASFDLSMPSEGNVQFRLARFTGRISRSNVHVSPKS